MIPQEAQRPLPYGFLYLPPFRVQGYSIAGEETFVQIPELDVCFDIGRAPRPALTSNYVALSHGHMDHAAGLAYYFSQRFFQGMGEGTVVCHPKLADAIHAVMNAWTGIEAQKTPYHVIPIEPDGELEIKKNFYLRAFDTDHTVPSLGFMVVEKRSKLKDEYAGLPQSKLVELKQQGTEITYIKEVVHVAYTGDTSPGPHLLRDDLRAAKIFICECTFIEHEHRSRARVGKHMHISDVAKLLPELSAEHAVLIHLSRRTHLGKVREQLDKEIPADWRDRVHILMDHRTNRARYQQQFEAAQAQQAAAQASSASEG